MRTNNKRSISLIISMTALLIMSCVVMTSCNKTTPKLQENPKYKKFRIDAVSIILEPKLEIEHLKNI